MKTDFNYIDSLISEFTNLQTTIDAFLVIDEQEITGWEVWFQIEFARFLAAHPSEPDWWREWPIEFDYRREKYKYFFRPDFIIRKKGWIKDSFAVLEVEQHPNFSICINRVIDDLSKVDKARQSELNIRTIWGLVFFKSKPSDVIEEKIINRCKNSSFSISKSCMRIQDIGDTNFSYALF